MQVSVWIKLSLMLHSQETKRKDGDGEKIDLQFFFFKQMSQRIELWMQFDVFMILNWSQIQADLNFKEIKQHKFN